MPFPLALLLTALHPAWWPVLALVFAVRAGAAWVVATRVLDAEVEWWLLPFEDVISFCFWIAGYFGTTIVWRNRRYRLKRDGKFELI
jgi:ceramide glucosyltransferase